MEIGNWNTYVEIIFQNLALIVFDRKWEDAAAVAVFMVIMLSVSLHQWCVIMQIYILFIIYKYNFMIPELKSMNNIVHKWVKGLTATGI